MARNSTHRPLARGIEFFNIENLTHVMRIDMRAAKPFYVGSITGAVQQQGTVDYVRKFQLSDHVLPRLRHHQYDFQINGKKLTPLWVSNGTFMGDDCWKTFDASTNKGVGAASIGMWLAGTVVHRRQPVVSASPTIILPRRKRWGFFQPIGAGNMPGNAIEIKRETTLHNAQYYSRPQDEEWYSVITGAGCLIENGVAHTQENAALPSGGSFNNSAGNPQYCAGPVIAHNDDKTVLYLIQDLTNRNNQSTFDAGRKWGQMAQYLKGSAAEGSFLQDIQRTRDGSIRAAIVYDGGASWGLWIRGHGLINGYNNGRPISHGIGLWAQKD